MNSPKAALTSVSEAEADLVSRVCMGGPLQGWYVMRVHLRTVTWVPACAGMTLE